MFELFLQRLANVLRFSELRPDPYGACCILIKERHISLLFEWDDELVPNTILLSSPLISYPLEYRKTIYRSCLKANFSTEETISIKPDEDAVYLHQRLHPDIDETSLFQVIENFKQAYLALRDHFQQLLEKPPQDGGSSEDSQIRIFPFKV